MIPLLDRRSVCLLLPYMQGLVSFSSLSSPPEESFLSLGQELPTTIVATAIPNSTTNSNDTISHPSETLFNLEILARFIVTYTPREVLEAIRDSGGKFLYRGEEPNDGVSCYFEKDMTIGKTNHSPIVRVCDPTPDLLFPETYGNDPLALYYFQQLEDFLVSISATSPTTDVIFMAKPSNGHIATSDPSEAGKWGNVVSVWPLLPVENDKEGDAPPQKPARFSYVWPRNQPVFYAADTLKQQYTKNIKQFDSQSLVENEKLREALIEANGREVLFSFSTSSAAFVAIPAELDQPLREELENIGYGL